MKQTFKRLREVYKLSQDEFDKICRLPKGSFGHFERGTRLPSLTNLKKIVNGLEISSDDLLKGIVKDYIVLRTDFFHFEFQHLFPDCEIKAHNYLGIIMTGIVEITFNSWEHLKQIKHIISLLKKGQI